GIRSFIENMKFMMKKIFLATTLITTVLLSGCATESSRSLEVAKVASYGTQYNGPRSPQYGKDGI
ncbi:TPA: hypothetical protein ACPZPR_000650, partial [Yersinia enterocolitica]